MHIVKSKSGKKAIGIAMAVTIVASIFAMIAPASVADVPTPMPDLIVTDINSYHNNTGCPAWFKSMQGLSAEGGRCTNTQR